MTVEPRRERREPIVDGRLVRLPSVIMRGGTSKAVFLHESDLPADEDRRDALIQGLYGSPHPRQIDGLGGADPLTSKLAIIGEAPDDPVADVRYTFGQVSITESTIDYKLNCGNISSAVGYFALEEGLVEPEEPVTTVTIRNTNNDVIITNEVPIRDGRPQVVGDFSISGVGGTGARVNVGFRDPGGERTGDPYPLGRRHEVETADGRAVPATLVDAAGTPSLFLRGSDFGLSCTEPPEELDADRDLIEELIGIRKRAAVDSGIVDTLEEAATTHIPAPVLLADPTEYTSIEGDRVGTDDVSLLVRRFLGAYPSDCHCHKAFAGTGTICLGLASQHEGTLVHDFVAREFDGSRGRTRVIIGHPSGTMDALVDADGEDVHEVAVARTARRLMDGVGYVPPVG